MSQASHFDEMSPYAVQRYIADKRIKIDKLRTKLRESRRDSDFWTAEVHTGGERGYLATKPFTEEEAAIMRREISRLESRVGAAKASLARRGHRPDGRVNPPPGGQRKRCTYRPPPERRHADPGWAAGRPCRAEGKKGECRDRNVKSAMRMNGKWHKGKCPGARNIQCFVPADAESATGPPPRPPRREEQPIIVAPPIAAPSPDTFFSSLWLPMLVLVGGFGVATFISK